MFIPATISLILITLFLNFNLFTKQILLSNYDFFGNSNGNGKVMGIMEKNPPANLSAEKLGADTDLAAAHKKLNYSINEIINNVKEIAVSNATDNITVDDYNSSQLILEKRRKRIKNQPIVNCDSALVYDLRSGRHMFSKEKEKILPIASITKLMSALVFVDTHVDWNKIYEIQKKDRIEGGRIILFTGEKIKVRDLFNLSLVGSDNMAILALVHSTGLDEDEFVKKMNDKAAAFGMRKTSFTDPTGLDDHNVSTAFDLVILARESFSNPDIVQAVSKKEYSFSTEEGRKKYIKNTDNLLGSNIGGGISIIGGKTGYNEAAGYCFVGKFIKNDQPIISVVLKAGTKNSRFTETEKIVKWAYEDCTPSL